MSFATYTARRLAWTAVLLVLISCACFAMLNFVPGSFFDEMRIDPRVSSADVEALRAAHGLSKPALERFGLWAQSAVRGDFGISFASNRPVLELLLPTLRNTLTLTIPAMLVAWIVGLTIGIWSAAAPASWLDRMANFLSTALNTVPELVLCCLGLLAATRTGLFPVGGMRSPRMPASLADLARHMLLPVSILAAVTVPAIFWHTRAAVLDTLGSPFVQSARAHGISRAALLWRHILPVASNPLISLAGISFGGLLSASLVTEVLFAWPGVGPLFLDAIAARDPYLIIAAILCFAAMLIAGNVIADLALYHRDPRLRAA